MTLEEKRVLDTLEKSEQDLNKKFESVIAIDKDNLRIAKYNGSFEKEIELIRKKFQISKLNPEQDIRLLNIMVEPDGRLLGVWEEDLRDYLKSRDIPYTSEAVNRIYFGSEERQTWLDTLSEKRFNEFRFAVFRGLGNLGLSFGLYPWLEAYILYGEEQEISGLFYDWALSETFDLLKALGHSYPLTTAEKRALYKFTKKLVIMNRRGETIRFNPKGVKEALKTLPPRKERRKRMLDKAIQATEKHGTEMDFYEPEGGKEGKWQKIKTTDAVLANQLYEEDNVSTERIKKLRQRYKSILKK